MRFDMSNDCGYPVQKIELQRQTTDSNETVRGHIVVSLISRDRGAGSPQSVDVGDLTAILPSDDPNELAERWESYFYNIILDITFIPRDYSQMC